MVVLDGTFWLLDTGVQLVYEPFGWHDEWYVDLVDIVVHADEVEHFVGTDQYLDVVVESMGPTYRMLDLDEFGTAMRDGALSLEAGASVLARAQRFLDKYLHRGAVFPPPEIARWFSTSHGYPATS